MKLNFSTFSFMFLLIFIDLDYVSVALIAGSPLEIRQMMVNMAENSYTKYRGSTLINFRSKLITKISAVVTT